MQPEFTPLFAAKHNRNKETRPADTLVATFSLDEKGNLMMSGENGKPLSNASRKLMWEQLDWPRETLVDYQIDPDGAAVDLDVDLPEIEDIPSRTAKLNVNDQRLLIKKKSQQQIRLEYTRHIHGVCLRLAGTVLSTLPGINTVTLSAYSQRLDSGTGHVNDDYLLSINIERQALNQMNFNNLEQVNPIVALEQFDLRRNMTKTGVIKIVEPFGTVQ